MVLPGSGIAAQLMFKDETTWATAVTPDHGAEFNSETLGYNPTWLEGQGLHAGGQFVRTGRAVQSEKSVDGNVTMDFAVKGLGLLLKHALGSTATPVAAGSLWKYVHQTGPLNGYGLTMQVGTPLTTGTVIPRTFNGCKVSGWEISCNDGQLATLSLDLLAQNVTTATSLVAAAYPANNEVFKFSDVNVCKIGGTASTTSGVVSIAGGSTVASVIRGFSLKGTNPMKDDRFGLGNQGLRSEPIENALREYTLTLDTEWTNQAEFYDRFTGATAAPFQITFTGSSVSGGNYILDIVIPSMKVTSAKPNVSGPDVVGISAECKIYDDSVNNPLQITVTTTDTAL